MIFQGFSFKAFHFSPVRDGAKARRVLSQCETSAHGAVAPPDRNHQTQTRKLWI
jgi:hypothetical protein